MKSFCAHARRRGRALGLAVWVAVGGVGSAVSVFAEPPAESDAAAAEKRAAIPIDQLLKLPSSYQARPAEPVRAGATKKDWQARFEAAREAVDLARAELARARAELESIAGQSSSWQVAAPGQPAPTENSPLSYRLKQEIRRRSDALSQAERDLQDLEIQANLAGVPEDWR
jgi:hypothetical protein